MRGVRRAGSSLRSTRHVLGGMAAGVVLVLVAWPTLVSATALNAPAPIPGVKTSAAPAVASDGGQVWVAYRGHSGATADDVFLEGGLSGRWESAPEIVCSGACTTVAPAISFDVSTGLLWILWTDMGRHSVVAVHSTTSVTNWPISFSTPDFISNGAAATTLAPAACAMSGVVMAAYVNKGTTELSIDQYSGGTWSTPNVDAGVATKRAPSIGCQPLGGSGGGALVWTATNHTIDMDCYFSSGGSASFTSTVALNGFVTKQAPSINQNANLDGAVALAWAATTGKALNYSYSANPCTGTGTQPNFGAAETVAGAATTLGPSVGFEYTTFGTTSSATVWYLWRAAGSASIKETSGVMGSSLS